ncbi:hypothetical protein DVJ78_00680 [Humibacter sp. BT305]|nr:hypothetical protein DVJ78_00680 [Humibacter sp. BT305]
MDRGEGGRRSRRPRRLPVRGGGRGGPRGADTRGSRTRDRRRRRPGRGGGPMTAFVETLRRARIVAVLRADGAGALEAQLDAVREGGVRAIEVTTTAEGWQQVLRRAASEAEADVLVGAGTVTTIEQAEQALEAGARFLVSPYRVPDAVSAIARTAAGGGVPFVPGGFTPAEVAEAAQVGDGVAKLFPAATGGLAHLKAIRDVLPSVSIMPTGGIGPDDAADWLAAGAVAVGLGGALVRQPVARIRDLMSSVGAGA